MTGRFGSGRWRLAASNTCVLRAGWLWSAWQFSGFSGACSGAQCSLTLTADASVVAELVCVAGGRPVTLMGEWSIDGFLPLTLFAGGLAVAL